MQAGAWGLAMAKSQILNGLQAARDRAPGGALARRLFPISAAIGLALSLLPLMPPAALAQFVCDSTTPGGANGATATGAQSVACGSFAEAVGGGTSVGAFAGLFPNAANTFNSAFGNAAGSNVTGDNNNAFGHNAGSSVNGVNNSAFGVDAGQDVHGSLNSAFGAGAGNNVGSSTMESSGNSAFGVASGNNVLGDNNTAIGSQTGGAATLGVTGNANTASGFFSGNTVTGDANIATGAFVGNTVTGSNNIAIGSGVQDSNFVDGTGQNVTGNNNIALGSFAGHDVTASNTIAVGTNAQANKDGGIAMGMNAFAAGPGDTAIGQGASVGADNSSAFGAGATVLAGHTNSTALGTGATTTRANQIMLGTASTTYTAPGITSNASRAAQGTPTHLVTSNAAGDLAAYTPHELGLASQGDIAGLQGDINRLGQRDRKLTEGIATVAALAQPMLLPGQHVAMRAGWGGYDGASAVSFTMAGLLGSNLLHQGSGTLVVDGGVGFGTDEGEVAGRAGMTFGW
jgi:hypothetical protein